MPKVRFLAMNQSWVADVPLGTNLLAAARAADAPEGSACGGVCACSTCHVYVREGRQNLSDAEEAEEDILDKAFDVRLESRLGCQAKVEKDGLITVEITTESLDAFYNEHPDHTDPRKAG